jgi:hypothetical protein
MEEIGDGEGLTMTFPKTGLGVAPLRAADISGRNFASSVPESAG